MTFLFILYNIIIIKSPKSLNRDDQQFNQMSTKRTTTSHLKSYVSLLSLFLFSFLLFNQYTTSFYFNNTSFYCNNTRIYFNNTSFYLNNTSFSGNINTIDNSITSNWFCQNKTEYLSMTLKDCNTRDSRIYLISICGVLTPLSAIFQLYHGD